MYKRQVLREIGAGDIPHIVAFNKMDLVESEDKLPIVPQKTFCVSAKEDSGIDELIEAVGSVIYADLRTAELLIPYAQGQISSYLCEKCTVHRMDYRDEGCLLYTSRFSPHWKAVHMWSRGWKKRSG